MNSSSTPPHPLVPSLFCAKGQLNCRFAHPLPSSGDHSFRLAPKNAKILRINFFPPPFFALPKFAATQCSQQPPLVDFVYKFLVGGDAKNVEGLYQNQIKRHPELFAQSSFCTRMHALSELFVGTEKVSCFTFRKNSTLALGRSDLLEIWTFSFRKLYKQVYVLLKMW